jgi:hypothetical protein
MLYPNLLLLKQVLALNSKSKCSKKNKIKLPILANHLRRTSAGEVLIGDIWKLLVNLQVGSQPKPTDKKKHET